MGKMSMEEAILELAKEIKCLRIAVLSLDNHLIVESMYGEEMIEDLPSFLKPQAD